MSKVRLLFAPENIGIAEKIAGGLVEQGYAMASEDKPASVVVVIWSAGAVASPSILSAARGALARRILVPVALGKAPPPPSFEHLWPMDLSGWTGGPEDPRWRFVLDEVELAARRGVEVAADVAPAPSPKRAAAEAPKSPAKREDIAADADDIFAAQPIYQASAAAASPRIPKIAVAGVAVLFLALGAGAFMIGKTQVARRAEPVAGAPVVAFVQPKESPESQPADEVDAAPLPPIEIASAENSETPATIDVEDATTAAADLRDPATSPPTSAVASAVGATSSVTPPPPSVKKETIASLAEDALRERPDGEAQSPEVAAADEPLAEGDADPIGALAWDATRDDAVAEAASFGSYFRDCLDCPDMAEIRPADGRAYALGVREITNAQWRACVADGACQRLAGGADAMPASGVSYADASSFVAWLSGKTGVAYRLPNESEWAAAAEGAPTDAARANVKGGDIVRGRTTQAGAFSPNSLGLYDMAGNVWEWTQDCWVAEGVAPASIGDCGARVLRGGAYDTPAQTVADGARDGAPSTMRRANAGFRVARDLY
jgi:hypothetical protein